MPLILPDASDAPAPKELDRLFLVLNTTPDGVWVPLVGYESEQEAELLVGNFADAKEQAAKQGMLGKGAAAMFAGRAVALDSSFAIAELPVKTVKPENLAQRVKLAKSAGGQDVSG
jgi:hypothetical protein